MIYFTSDTHFCHNRDFIYGPRGFSSIQEHDETIIKRWNEIVSPEDEVYHLGDIMLMNNEQGLAYFRQLYGHFHIILGNHCTSARIELYKTLDKVIDVNYANLIKIKKQHYFVCHYPTITSNYDDKPYHSHLINLFGHTHSKEKFYNNNPFIYNVALDAHNCYPVSIEEIENDIHQKINELNTLKMKGLI